MAPTIYALCTLTSLACAWLLLRSFSRTRYRLLFWSGLCFVVLTISNALLMLDRLAFPEIDMSTIRLGVALLAVSLLVFGLIWEED